MRVMISQSNYIPWHGFFAALRAVDVFVILDTVQFTRRDWRSRNRIVIDGKPKWLSIPVSGSRMQRINEVMVADPTWSSRHLGLLRAAYGHHEHNVVQDFVDDMYKQVAHMNRLTEVNEHVLRILSELLGIRTPFLRSEDMPDSANPSERLALMAQYVGATEYWSGPSAEKYLDHEPFDEAGISVHFFDFTTTQGSIDDDKSGDIGGLSVLHDLATSGVLETTRRATGLG